MTVLAVVVALTSAGSTYRVDASSSKTVQFGGSRLTATRSTRTAQAARREHRKLWLCIHRHEAAWNDSGAPYWGGLQMGWWFHRTYARDLTRRRGTADHWPPVVQMRVAENAYRREGWSRRWLAGQWPTVRYCWRFA